MNGLGNWALVDSRARALAAAAGLFWNKFWNWWLEELLGLIPERWQQRLRRRGNLLIIEVDEQSLGFRFGSFGNAELITRVTLGEDGSLPGLSIEQLDARVRKADQVILLVPEQRVLRKVITLPAATEPRLENVLRFEMDRYTPFTSEQVFFGYRIVSRERERERIQVELLVVQRDYIDPLLASLAQIDVQPGIVTLPESLGSWSGATVNLLPASRSHGGQGKWGRNRRLQVAMALLLLVVLIGWPLHQRQQTLTRLQSELQQLKAQAEQSKGVSTELEYLETSRKFLLHQQDQGPRLLLLLNELTGLLPDHTWLMRFEDNGTSFRLDGESAEASGLISLLEQSPLLENVRFASPVTSNPNTAKDRFSLVAERSKTEQAP